MNFVSVTRLHLRRWIYLPSFYYYAILSLRDAKNTEGNFSASAFRDVGLTFWTVTVWKSEAAMRSFRNSGAHRKVMSKLANWCDEAAYVNWCTESDEEPSREEAYAQLIAKGSFSKVKYPSASHLNGSFTSPMSKGNG